MPVSNRLHLSPWIVLEWNYTTCELLFQHPPHAILVPSIHDSSSKSYTLGMVFEQLL